MPANTESPNTAFPDFKASLFTFRIALLTVILTIITFTIAVMTPPLSGPFAEQARFFYPFTDTIDRFPRDFWWMIPAIFLNGTYLVLMICIDAYAPLSKKIYSRGGLLFAAIAAALLIVNYFVQLSVIQTALLNNETDGVAMLSQYNPHGLFIVLEELGFILMSVSFIWMVPVFSGTEKMGRLIRRVLQGGFWLTVLAFVIISALFGLEREYRFEVAVISIDWLTLIALGVLLALYFRKR